MVEKDKISEWNATAANKQFAKSGALTRVKINGLY
jgi:hypothetical protein